MCEIFIFCKMCIYFLLGLGKALCYAPIVFSSLKVAAIIICSHLFHKNIQTEIENLISLIVSST